MNNADLELAEAMDQDTQMRTDVQNAKVSEGVQERLRTSGLDVTGPSSEDYDYVGADRAGTPFTPIEGGGVNLPNKFNQNRYVAGRRVSDGMKVHPRNDPNGFGAEGFRRMQESYINTESGAPAEAMDAVMPLMAEHIQNGGTLEDFDDPTGMASDAHQTLKATSAIQAIAHELRSLPPSEDVESVDAVSALTMEDVAADPQFLAAGRVLREHFGMDDTEAKSEMKAGRPVPGTTEQVEVSDEEIVEDMIEEIAATFSSAWKMGSLIYAIESGDMSPDTQAAYAYAFDVYDRLSMWNPDVLQGTAKGIAMDAPLYAAGGGIGTVIAKTAAKTAMVKHVMGRLAAHQVKTSMGVAAGAGAVEGGGFGAAEEATRQKVTGQENMDQVWNAGVNTAIAGAVLMTPFGALLSKPGREFVKRAYHSIADKVGRSKTPVNAKDDWIPVSESETYNGTPAGIDDMGVPMADSAGTSYYSRLYRTAVEDGLIGNKETDPMKYLQILKKRQMVGRFKGYEMQEAGLEDFLERKANAGSTVNKDMVDDYLWANRPRVNSLLSTADDFTGPASEMLTAYYSPKRLRRTEAARAVKNNFFETEEVMDAQGEQAWKVTNKITKVSEVTSSPGTYLADQTRAMLSNMSDDEVVGLVRKHDRQALLSPPRWGTDVGDKGSPTIIKGENANNYQELRLFLPYGGMDNIDDIGMERFGDVYDNLTKREQKRVLRIKGFATEKRPESLRSEYHYPLEHNLLVQVRTQELFQPQNGGQRVLAVNEMQSDMHQVLRESDKATEGGQYTLEDSLGNELKQPDKQATAGWVNMTVNRTLQLAQQQGYNKVAFPVHPDMITSIQLWQREQDVSEHVIKFYDTVSRMIRKDKKLAKTWGIESVQLEDVSGAVDGQPLSQQMMVITFDPTKSKGPKPIYGIGVTSGAGGTMSIDAKSEDE